MRFRSESTGLRSRIADGVRSSESQQAQNPRRASVSVQVQMPNDECSSSTDPAGGVPFSPGIFVLCRSSVDWTGGTHHGEGSLFYSVYLFKG